MEGTIVSASLYRRGGVTCYSNQVDERVWQFARERLAQWSPNRAFCLDVADTPNGLKVVEINAINSSAFYAGDIGRFVEAINRMEAGDLVRADGVNNPLGYRTVAPAGALQSRLLTRKPR